MRNWIMLGIAAAGLVWLYLSLEAGIKRIIAAVKEGHPIKGFVNNKPLKDFIISLAVIYFAYVIFIGVTGMLIGLLASVFISIIIRIKG